MYHFSKVSVSQGEVINQRKPKLGNTGESTREGISHGVIIGKSSPVIMVQAYACHIIYLNWPVIHGGKGTGINQFVRITSLNKKEGKREGSLWSWFSSTNIYQTPCWVLGV